MVRGTIKATQDAHVIRDARIEGAENQRFLGG